MITHFSELTSDNKPVITKDYPAKKSNRDKTDKERLDDDGSPPKKDKAENHIM